MENNPNPEPQNNPNLSGTTEQHVQPVQTVQPTAPASITPQSTDGKNKLKLFVSLGIGFIILIAIGVAAFLLLKPLTPEQMYYGALQSNVSLSTDSKLAVSIETKSNTTTLSATSVGKPGAEHADATKMNIKTSSDTMYGKISLDVDAIIIGHGDSQKTYSKYNSMTSSDSDLNDVLKDSFSKDWYYTVGDEEKSESNPSANSLDILGLFAPMLAFDKKDADIYVSEAKKAQVFKIGKEAIDATFKGQKVKELSATVNKDTYSKFINDINKVLSSKGKDSLDASKEDIETIFGDNDNIDANIYIIDGDIVGIDMTNDMTKYGSDDVTDTEKTDITVSIDYDTSTTIKAPEGAKLTTPSETESESENSEL